MQNKTKMAINNAVWMARYSGILKSEPCEKCGVTEHIHAHHDDYNYPLKVRWLCDSCHGKFHGTINDTIQPLPEICDKKPTFYYKLGIEQMGGKYVIKGRELREWRKKEAITQELAAQLIGVSYPTYKKWESEKRMDVNIPQMAAIIISLMKKEGWELDINGYVPA